MEQLRYKIYSDDGMLHFHKPVIVFLHGLGGGYANWHRQIHTLRKRYDLVLIELPSHGKSQVKISEMEVSFDALSRKIMDVVDSLGIQKATYAGVSLGTMIVKHLVLNYPDRVDKYILAGPIGDFTFVLRMAINLVRYLMPILPLDVILKLVCLVVMPYKASKYGRDIFLACAKKVPKKEFIVWCKLLTSFKDIQKTYQKTMGEEPNGMYIVGELDHFFIPMLKNDRNRVKNLVFVKNAGHICISDEAEVVNNTIIAFQETGVVTG